MTLTIGERVSLACALGAAGAATAAITGCAPPVAGAILMGSATLTHVVFGPAISRVNMPLRIALFAITVVGSMLAGIGLAGLAGYVILPLTAAKILGGSVLVAGGIAGLVYAIGPFCDALQQKRCLEAFAKRL